VSGGVEAVFVQELLEAGGGVAGGSVFAVHHAVEERVGPVAMRAGEVDPLGALARGEQTGVGAEDRWRWPGPAAVITALRFIPS
jgi:hypothetical protein